MALSATIYKCRLQISDMDRGYYATHDLTIAQHPSENDVRMMARVMAFALHADEALQFTRGLSSDDEPDLWMRNLGHEIVLWIELGQPDEKRIRRACGRAHEVVVYGYHERPSTVWWKQHGDALQRFHNLSVRCFDDGVGEALAALAQRGMELSVLIQDGEAWVSDEERQVRVSWQTFKEAAK